MRCKKDHLGGEVMSQLIAFSGSHGTGKTTAAYNHALHLKYAHPDQSVHALVDQEAFCPYPINQQATPESQLWIFTNKINQELSLLKRFDIVVTDRTVIDVIAYTFCQGFDSMAMTMLEVAKDYISIYHQITFRKIINNEYCYADGMRDAQDQIFRYQIEELLLNYYEELTEASCITGVFKYV